MIAVKLAVKEIAVEKLFIAVEQCRNFVGWEGDVVILM